MMNVLNRLWAPIFLLVPVFCFASADISNPNDSLVFAQIVSKMYNTANILNKLLH